MVTKTWRAGKSVCRLQRWGDFRREIAALIRLLGKTEGRFIIFAQRNKNKHRFVQFRVFADGVIGGEAVSNNFLEKGQRPTASTHRFLVELGWQKPWKTSPNFWSTWQPPPPIEKIASLAATTLRDAFEIASPAGLEIDCHQAQLKLTGNIYEIGKATAWKQGGGLRGSGIKMKHIDHFDARGLKRVYGRGDDFGRHRKFNMDVWLARSGRLLARFWSRSSDIDSMSLEIIGCSRTPAAASKRCEIDNEWWIPQRLRDEYDDWIISGPPLS
jgi:hypothetical protein